MFRGITENLITLFWIKTSHLFSQVLNWVFYERSRIFFGYSGLRDHCEVF